MDEFVLNTKYTVRKWAGSKVVWFGLDTATVILEKVPMFIMDSPPGNRINRELPESK